MLAFLSSHLIEPSVNRLVLLISWLVLFTFSVSTRLEFISLYVRKSNSKKKRPHLEWDGYEYDQN